MENAVEDLVGNLVRDRARVLDEDSVWLTVLPPGIELPEHGWKLHVSSRSATYCDLVTTLVPVLLDEGCVFKLANSPRTLSELNDGRTPAAVGKAFTIYPAPDRARGLGLELVELLRGWVGPRVLSDRRIDDSAPVYYRYGPFTGGWRSDEKGRPLMSMRGPDGAEFDGEATTGYRRPPWAVDPFGGANTDDDLLLGDRYRVVEGVYESVRGNVFRAVDDLTGESVVVKQARALVSEDSDCADTRMRIRNERRILEAAEQISGLPRFVDHFRHLDDEFLVTTDQGSTDLSDDIRENGPFCLDPGGDRSLPRLATALARILRDLHARGILMRDLAPKNIVLSPDGPCLIDFGIAAYEGVHLKGGTPGYAPAGQMRDDPPADTDDLYALGITLIEALSGLPPVALDDGRWSRERALETVRVLHGESSTGLVAAIVDLLSDNGEVARRAFRWLLEPSGDHRAQARLSTRPAVTGSRVEELTAHALDDLVVAVDALLADSSRTFRRQDLTVYSGVTGAGLELVHHRSHPHVLDLLSRLGRVIRERVEEARLDPGLFVGRTGIEIFFETAELPGPKRWSAEAGWEPIGHDLIEGAAGIGIGHLWLYERDGDPRDREVAERCAGHLAGLVDSDAGLAHGLAGVLEFELRMADAASGSEAGPEAGSEIERLADRLVPATEELLERARRGNGDPLVTVSWCNGLAGLARTLRHAGRRLDRPDLALLAVRAVDACAGWVPRLRALGQCCGAAGIGDLLLDFGRPEQALEVVEHLVLRAGGPRERPAFVGCADQSASFSWSAGLPGILGFLRRVRDGGGPRILPAMSSERQSVGPPAT